MSARPRIAMARFALPSAALLLILPISACSSNSPGGGGPHPDAPHGKVDMAVSRVDGSTGTTDGAGGHTDMSTTDAPPPACDVVAQNCATGMKCTLVAGSTAGSFVPKCEPDGTVAEGAACTLSSTGDNCLHGSLCLSSVCTRFCTLGMDSQCTFKSGGLCDLVITGSMPMTSVCDYPASCDPLKQNCTDTTTACYWDPSKKMGDCFSAGTKTTGSACVYANDCVKGDFCYATSSSGGTCVQLCSLGADAGGPACPSGKTCTTLGSDPVGYCK